MGDNELVKICTYQDCGRPHQGRGYCATHLRQFNSGKDLTPIRLYSNAFRLCEFPECGRPHQARNLCTGHYHQHFQLGHELAPLKKRTPGDKRLCDFPDCGRTHNAKGLCMGHYVMRKRGDELRPLNPVGTGGFGWKDHLGYRWLMQKNHPNANPRGEIREHTVVMSQILGRALLPGENVHHMNGVRDDNRPENLELWVSSQPSGQRPADLVEWAHEILRRYDDGGDGLPIAV